MEEQQKKQDQQQETINEDALLIPYKKPQELNAYDQPVEFQCDTCNKEHVSIVEYKPGKYTWICCVTLFIFGGVLGFLPFYIKDCQDATSKCPECNQNKGVKLFKPC